MKGTCKEAKTKIGEATTFCTASYAKKTRMVYRHMDIRKAIKNPSAIDRYLKKNQLHFASQVPATASRKNEREKRSKDPEIAKTALEPRESQDLKYSHARARTTSSVGLLFNIFYRCVHIYMFISANSPALLPKNNQASGWIDVR